MTAKRRNPRIDPLPVTACSVLSACGSGTRSLHEALLAGQHRLQRCELIELEFPAYVGEIAESQLPQLDPRLAAFSTRNTRIALAVLDQPEDGLRAALQGAVSRYGAGRVGVIIGTSTSGIYETEAAYAYREQHQALPADFSFVDRHIWSATARFLQQELALTGPCYAVSTACSSSSKTLASAQRLIANGVCDAVLTGGVDSLCHMTLYGFKSLDIMSEKPCTPLDRDRSGISLGEAGGLLLLERPQPEHADCVHLLGCGESSDAYHMTAPHPEGRGAIAAMQQALAQAGLGAPDIDYVNLHATGTRLNDEAEMAAMAGVFTADMCCSGTKGLTGHTLGAAGAVESIVTWLSLVHGFMPGTCNLKQVDEAFACNVLRHSVRDVPVRIAMNNNFGFGGNNTSLILGRTGA
jgi:3-oxoacyl-[acyl-carrier-protein] synthase-1